MIVSALFSHRSVAAEVIDTFQMHGFMSQALIISDHNNFFGPSSQQGGSLEYTELGLNASVRPTQKILLAAQMLSRKAGQGSSITDPELDYGVLDYQLLADEQRTLGLQLGRFKNPFGFYNQTRDIPATRPGILLPQSIYFDRTRSLGLASDGFTVYSEEHLAGGTLHLQGGIGIPQVDRDAEIALSPVQPSLDGRISFIGQILYEHDGGHINIALSAARVRSDFDSGDTGPGSGEFIFQPVILSFQYNEEKWSFTAEYEYRQNKFQGFDNPEVNSSMIGESWYLQYVYRFNEQWQWLLRYDDLIQDHNDRSGQQYEADGKGASYSRFARDYTTGVRWRLEPGVILAAEWHHVDGTGWLAFQDNRDTESKRYWNMFLFQASWLF